MDVKPKDEQQVVQNDKPNLMLMAGIGILIYFLFFKK